MLKDWYSRREKVYIQAEVLRTEAYEHGVGELTVYGRLTRSAAFLDRGPAAVLLLPGDCGEQVPHPSLLLAQTRIASGQLNCRQACPVSCGNGWWRSATSRS